jgi:hypothetical protein
MDIIVSTGSTLQSHFKLSIAIDNLLIFVSSPYARAHLGATQEFWSFKATLKPRKCNANKFGLN